MSKKSRDKGARFERKIAKILNEFGYTARRTGDQWNGRGDTPDVRADGYGHALYVECTDQEKLPGKTLLDKFKQGYSYVAGIRERDGETVYFNLLVMHVGGTSVDLAVSELKDLCAMMERAYAMGVIDGREG